MPNDPNNPTPDNNHDPIAAHKVIEADCRQRIASALAQLPGGQNALPFHVGALNTEALVQMLVDKGLFTKLEFLQKCADVAESTVAQQRQQGRIVIPRTEPRRFRG